MLSALSWFFPDYFNYLSSNSNRISKFVFGDSWISSDQIVVLIWFQKYPLKTKIITNFNVIFNAVIDSSSAKISQWCFNICISYFNSYCYWQDLHSVIPVFSGKAKSCAFLKIFFETANAKIEEENSVINYQISIFYSIICLECCLFYRFCLNWCIVVYFLCRFPRSTA